MNGILWSLYPSAQRLRVWYYRRCRRIALDRDERDKACCMRTARAIEQYERLYGKNK